MNLTEPWEGYPLPGHVHPAHEHHVPMLDHGSLELVKVAGDEKFIEQCARVSYAGHGTDRTDEETTKLLRHLLRSRHTSPFEMAVLWFRIKAPIFVARQWVRHRMASWNEISGRYAPLPNEFFMPDVWRAQSKANKQGSDGTVEHFPLEVRAAAEGHAEPVVFSVESFAMQEYQARMGSGVANEIARTCVPVSTYTEWYWKIDLHNLMHFLTLRMDPHAQPEIVCYAEQIGEWVKEHFPITWQAFVDYRLNAITFTGPELEAIFPMFENVQMNRAGLDALTERKKKELTTKLGRAGAKF